MKKYILTTIMLVSICFANTQTIVKMSVPPQAAEPLKVTVLFDEPVPEGMPVVLGLIGYNVTGGITPYTYEWLQNGEVVGTGDIVVVTPKKDDTFALKATDKNRCYSVNSFSMRVISRIDTNEAEKSECQVFPTLVKNDIINITLPKSKTPLQARIRILDMDGKIHYQTHITENSSINHSLPGGAYFVSVQTDEFHKVEKIIVQH